MVEIDRERLAMGVFSAVQRSRRPGTVEQTVGIVHESGENDRIEPLGAGRRGDLTRIRE